MGEGSFIEGLLSPGPAIEHLTRSCSTASSSAIGGRRRRNGRLMDRRWKVAGTSASSGYWKVVPFRTYGLRRHGPSNRSPGRRPATATAPLCGFMIPKSDAWHIIWINPPTGTVVRQLGRRIGEEIVQLGQIGDDGAISRWVYRDIKPSSFRWCNERSVDNGARWKLMQEMRAVRVV